MVPGSIDSSGEWIESGLAGAIEDAMVAAGVINVGKESRANTRDRRAGFVAVSSGLIQYLKENMDLEFVQGVLRSATSPSQEVPPATKTILQAVK
jgi:hypothetical protein